MTPFSGIKLSCNACSTEKKIVWLVPYYKGGTGKKKHPDAWICPTKDCGCTTLYDELIQEYQKYLTSVKEEQEKTL